MSFWDNVKKITKPYADDEYDEYDDYDEEDDYVDDYEEPEAPVRRAPRRTSAPAAPVSDPVEEEEDSFGFDPVTPSAPVSVTSARDFGGKVLNISNGSRQDVVLFHPNTFKDTSKMADELKNKKALIVNMENVDSAMARRIVDFLTGCVYAMDGQGKKIARSAYLFCPSNVNIVGDLETLQAEVESYV